MQINFEFLFADVQELQCKDIRRKIGGKFKELRIAAGYTSYETFALEFELSRRYYWGVENGQNITIDYLVKLLNIHQVGLSDFFNDID